MSALTRARTGNRVTFKDAAGHLRNGVCLYLRADHIVVGVQNSERPWVWGVVRRVKGKDGVMRPVEGRIANNSVWAVPFASVIETYSGNPNHTSASRAG